MVLIDAVYIHESGGKTLLDYFISGIIEKETNYILFLDKRLKADFVNYIPESNIIFVEATELNRFKLYKIYNMICSKQFS